MISEVIFWVFSVISSVFVFIGWLILLMCCYRSIHHRICAIPILIVIVKWHRQAAMSNLGDPTVKLKDWYRYYVAAVLCAKCGGYLPIGKEICTLYGMWTGETQQTITRSVD